MESSKDVGELERKEWLKCGLDPAYFLDNYGWIYDATARRWQRFDLWPAQLRVLGLLLAHRLLVVLKARQLGLTWLLLGYALWLMLFRPIATVLIFSKRDDEAMELLDRLKKMYVRLPAYMRAKATVIDNEHEFELSNGSRALAFPTTGGRSYTATLAIADEADYIPNLSTFLNAVKPTVDAGGQLALISTPDKDNPLSTFKNIFRAAWAKANEYLAVFLPWSERPGRSLAWYARVKAEMIAQDGSDDNLFQEYPSTVDEALVPKQLGKRIPFEWIKAVTDESGVVLDAGPGIPGLVVYVAPGLGRSYVIGADSAEGNPNSDDSAAVVVDALDWSEVATLAGKFEPAVFASYVDQLAAYYNDASAMPERNNHGHATILTLRTNGLTRVQEGHDGKAGWLSNQKGKTLMYDLAAEIIRDKSTTLRSPETRAQLAAVEAATLRAPQGLHDDYADAYCLALCALRWGFVSGEPAAVVVAEDPLQAYDRGGF